MVKEIVVISNGESAMLFTIAALSAKLVFPLSSTLSDMAAPMILTAMEPEISQRFLLSQDDEK